MPSAPNLPVVHTDDRPIRWIGYLVLIATLGVFGIWSYLAPIDASSLAPGNVTVKSHRKTVQHLDGGIVSKLLIKDGDSVKAGDDLVILDDVQIKAQVEMLRGQWLAQQALSDRLNAERSQQSSIRFSPKLNELKDARVQEAIATQNHSFQVRKSNHQGEISVLKQGIEQLGSKIAGLKAQKDSKHKLAASYLEEIQDLKELLAQGFADKQRLRELERNHTLTTGEIATLVTDLASAELQKGEMQIEILQSERKFQEDIAKQLEEVSAQLFDTNERLQAVLDKEQRTVIKAPASGIIFNLAVHTEGGVIAPGNPILDIVPEAEELIITAQVSPIDIDKIKVGAVSEVRFTAFDNKTTPVLEGKVGKISADSFSNEKNGNQYYLADIELTPNSQKDLGELKLIPGMPAEVLINIGSRTLFEYLMQPITDAFARTFNED